ncbi:MAG: L,D-transpeptidase [Syntrophobacter sp.]
MPKRQNPVRWVGFLCVLLMLSGCATRQVDMQQAENLPPYWEDLPEVRPVERPPVGPSKQPPKKTTKQQPALVKRVVTEKELRSLEQKDPDLHFNRAVEILSRLNGKDKEYIRDDIKRKRAITVPRDFASYKEWSPLPATIAGTGHLPKFIVIVKDICFLGWYEKGKLVGDTYVCIGKMNTWTKRGIYRIKDKDLNHMSTYPNAYGDPSLMPFALHIYDRVWIHAGDVIGRNCSHGCINVPLFTADKLYGWAQLGTPVLITESLKNLGRDVKAGLQTKPKPAEASKPATQDGPKPAQPLKTGVQSSPKSTN